MRMPTEHLSQIPVVALSPSVTASEHNPWWTKSMTNWGSAPTSPQKNLGVSINNINMSASYHGSSGLNNNK